MPVAETADGARLEWDASGTGEPMLLIAGQGVARGSWEPAVRRLSGSFRVIAFDQRGVGPSTLGDAPVWTTRALAADAVAVLDAARAPRAHVVGHSMGGRIAQWLAIDAPERVATLVLLATSAGDARGIPRPADATAALRTGDPETLAPYFYGAAFRREHPELVSALGRATVGLRARRGHFMASSDHDAWDELAGVHVPTLVVHGADDAITPAAHGRQLAARIPGAHYLEPSGGHGVHLEDPAVLDAVAGFAAAHPVA